MLNTVRFLLRPKSIYTGQKRTQKCHATILFRIDYVDCILKLIVSINTLYQTPKDGTGVRDSGTYVPGTFRSMTRK
jgi:hypothetical protein